MNTCKGADGEDSDTVMLNGVETKLIRIFDCEIFTGWRDNFNRWNQKNTKQKLIIEKTTENTPIYYYYFCSGYKYYSIRWKSGN